MSQNKCKHQDLSDRDNCFRHKISSYTTHITKIIIKLKKKKDFNFEKSKQWYRKYHMGMSQMKCNTSRFIRQG
ncbi:hypothetical protein Hanom_Chr05g00450701 [Helianthus anomalus]